MPAAEAEVSPALATILEAGARAGLDEAVAHAPLAHIFNLGPEIFHLLGHMAPVTQIAWDAPWQPPRLLVHTDGEVHEGVLDVVGARFSFSEIKIYRGS
jgi:hypothetical protein